MSRGCFVTGTDTGVGKTLAACTLLRALRARGIDVAAMKPIAAGASESGGRLANGDTRDLIAAAGLGSDDLDAVTPVLLREAIAPHIAAEREGRVLTLDPVIAAWRRRAQGSAYVVVEGVGGFKVPLGRSLDTVDLARAFNLPIVMVVGLRLGCLNHALLTAGAIRHEGLTLAGWIASAIDPAMAAREENIEALRRRLGAPCLGVLPHMPQPDPAVLARELDTSWLVR